MSFIKENHLDFRSTKLFGKELYMVLLVHILLLILLSCTSQAMHAAPMYIAETSPSQIRGQLISLKEFFIVLGMLVSKPAVKRFRTYICSLIKSHIIYFLLNPIINCYVSSKTT